MPDPEVEASESSPPSLDLTPDFNPQAKAPTGPSVGWPDWPHTQRAPTISPHSDQSSKAMVAECIASKDPPPRRCFRMASRPDSDRDIAQRGSGSEGGGMASGSTGPDVAFSMRHRAALNVSKLYSPLA